MEFQRLEINPDETTPPVPITTLEMKASQAPVPEHRVGPKSSVVDCPYCHACVKTKIEYTTTTRTHLLSMLMCLVCCLGCCCPFCRASTRNSDHYCPNCKRFLGTYKK